MKTLNRPSNQIVKDALNAFGFILPFNVDLSAREFAERINAFTVDPRARCLAAEIEASPYFVRRERLSTTIYLKL